MAAFVALFCLAQASLSTTAAAGVKAFKGEAMEQMFIESTSNPNEFFIKLTGTSPWDGKVIKTRLLKRANGAESYLIDWVKKTGIGHGPQEYEFVRISDMTLDSGSLVNVATSYFPGSNGDGLKLTYDKALSAASQGIGLAKAPKFQPDFAKK